jgi:hypothetical protein
VTFTTGIPLVQAARSQFLVLNALLQQNEQTLALPEGEHRRAPLAAAALHARHSPHQGGLLHGVEHSVRLWGGSLLKWKVAY